GAGSAVGTGVGCAGGGVASWARAIPAARAAAPSQNAKGIGTLISPPAGVAGAVYAPDGGAPGHLAQTRRSAALGGRNLEMGGRGRDRTGQPGGDGPRREDDRAQARQGNRTVREAGEADVWSRVGVRSGRGPLVLRRRRG